MVQDGMPVVVEILPWVSEELRPGEAAHLRFETRAATLRDLLKRLAAADAAFARLVYDPAADGPREYIQVLLNDRVVAWVEESGAPLNMGDRVTLISAYTGG